MDRVYTEKTETIFQFVSLGLCQLATETTDLPESSDTKCSTEHVYIKKHVWFSPSTMIHIYIRSCKAQIVHCSSMKRPIAP